MLLVRALIKESSRARFPLLHWHTTGCQEFLAIFLHGETHIGDHSSRGYVRLINELRSVGGTVTDGVTVGARQAIVWIDTVHQRWVRGEKNIRLAGGDLNE